MGKIQKMSPKLANLIAAGEVVERPTSVVKELIENSIDAHSTIINLYLKNAGLEEIKIVDNGDGMDKDDVVLAFLPHATSKIKNEYDLARINTLGFRGEAVASIAMVSKMQIISSTDGVEGYQCSYKSGVKVSQGIINSNKGTTVIVDELFFNTPARLKYMKPAKTELASILFIINRIALAHPEIRISVFNDDKNVFLTSGSNNHKTLIAEIYGVDAAKLIIENEYMFDGYKMDLLFVKPSFYRSNKLEITLICNGRYVKSYNITQAVIDGFSTYVPIGKFPVGVLYLDIDPLLIDVNVHPTKTEIKIANEADICIRLTNEIKKMLESHSHVPTRTIEKKESYVKPSIFEFSEPTVKEEASAYTPSYQAKEEKKELPKITPFTPSASASEFISNEPKVEAVDRILPLINEKKEPEPKKEAIVEVPEEDVVGSLPYMEYMTTLFGTYLLFQSKDSIYLVDQHAAAERANYEKYYAILGEANQPTTELLIPIMLTFTKAESVFIDDNISGFNAIGFELDKVGENDYAVRSIPLWAKLDEVDEIIYDVLSQMIDNRRVDIMQFRDHIAKQISCKASIKANHQLSRVEIDALLKNLQKCKNPFTCPHGRPCIIKLSQDDIEKMFERIQK